MLQETEIAAKDRDTDRVEIAMIRHLQARQLAEDWQDGGEHRGGNERRSRISLQSRTECASVCLGGRSAGEGFCILLVQTLSRTIYCVGMTVCGGKDIEGMPYGVFDADRLAYKVGSPYI